MNTAWCFCIATKAGNFHEKNELLLGNKSPLDIFAMSDLA